MNISIRFGVNRANGPVVRRADPVVRQEKHVVFDSSFESLVQNHIANRQGVNRLPACTMITLLVSFSCYYGLSSDLTLKLASQKYWTQIRSGVW